jgi:DNA processing protein
MNLGRTQNVTGLLTLMGLRGVGPATAERLAKTFTSFQALFESPADRIRRVTSASVSETLRQTTLLAQARAEADRIIEDAARLGVKIVSVFDETYPAALRLLPDRPAIIYVRGALPLGERNVACIGTREPSDFGVAVTERIVETLVSSNWSIVSGLALGIDAISHRAALRHGGRTIAIMGGGLDSIYPKQNIKLAEEILESNGTLISEQPFGVPPSPRNLVSRDRLQSGLSIATFVMQTDIKGGSMHTVRFTLMQGRLLFAPVPQGRHAEELKSQGILALTQCPANELVDRIRAEGEYRRLLLSRFGRKPVATPLLSWMNYEAMLDCLERGFIDHQRAAKSDLEEAQPSLL